MGIKVGEGGERERERARERDIIYEEEREVRDVVCARGGVCAGSSHCDMTVAPCLP